MSQELNNLVMAEHRREKHTRMGIAVCFASPIILLGICFVVSCVLRSLS